jgi:hypothetical protein
MADFLVHMSNRFQFSKCERPHKPITAPRAEIIQVELRGDLLTITAEPPNAHRARRIYAQKTLELPDATTFVILAQLPRSLVDAAFFPAMGTIVLFAPTASQARRLRAAGFDTNSRRCHGWIFDAHEA